MKLSRDNKKTIGQAEVIATFSVLTSMNTEVLSDGAERR